MPRRAANPTPNHPTPRFVCPSCGVEEEPCVRRPDGVPVLPGAWAVCVNLGCGEPAVFGDHMEARKPRPEEVEAFAKLDPWGFLKMRGLSVRYGGDRHSAARLEALVAFCNAARPRPAP
jgi:hypothetical protein